MRATWAQFKFELKLALRRGEGLLVTIFIPLLLLVFLGSVPFFSPDRSRRVAEVMPGLLALAVMSTGMVSLGIATAFERQYGFLKRLGATPLTRPQLLLAKGLTTLLTVCCQVLLLWLVGWWAFGWRPQGEVWLVAIWLLLGLAVFVGVGLWMAGALRAEATLAIANALYLVLMLLGGVVVPLSRLPDAIASVVRFLPTAALAELLRQSLVTGGRPSTLNVVVLLFWTILAPGAAVTTFKWE